MSKTAAKLLAQAAENDLGRVTVSHGVQGRRPYGARSIAAANKLAEAGRLERIRSTHRVVHLVGGTTCHAYEVTFALPRPA